MSPSLSHHDLVLLADNAVRAVAPLAGMRGVHLGRESSASSFVSACDRVRIERVLNALLVRAIERTPRGGAVSVRVDADSCRWGTALSVRSERAAATPEP